MVNLPLMTTEQQNCLSLLSVFNRAMALLLADLEGLHRYRAMDRSAILGACLHQAAWEVWDRGEDDAHLPEDVAKALTARRP